MEERGSALLNTQNGGCLEYKITGITIDGSVRSICSTFHFLIVNSTIPIIVMSIVNASFKSNKS